MQMKALMLYACLSLTNTSSLLVLYSNYHCIGATDDQQSHCFVAPARTLEGHTIQIFNATMWRECLCVSLSIKWFPNTIAEPLFFAFSLEYSLLEMHAFCTDVEDARR